MKLNIFCNFNILIQSLGSQNQGNISFYMLTGRIRQYRFFFKTIDGTVVCLSLTVNMARFGNINADEFT